MNMQTQICKSNICQIVYKILIHNIINKQILNHPKYLASMQMVLQI